MLYEAELDDEVFAGKSIKIHPSIIYISCFTLLLLYLIYPQGGTYMTNDQ